MSIAQQTPEPPSVRPELSGLTARPVALLLDFGGVLFETEKPVDGYARFAAWTDEQLRRGGIQIPVSELESVLRAGSRALKDWKNAASRRVTPTELDHRTIVSDFLVSPLQENARALLAGSAGQMLQTMSLTLSTHRVRAGIPQLLAEARELGVKVGIVSNAHSGRAHRVLLAEHGLEPLIDVQVYSDEVGLRKPNAEIIHLAARALGTTAEQCWYVGDTVDRDVVAGRRAGVSAVVLVHHHHTDNPPYPVSAVADAVYATPEGLVDTLRTAEMPSAAPGAVCAVPVRPSLPSALLLDHGGVIVNSVPDPASLRALAGDIAERLSRAGFEVDGDTVSAAIDAGRALHKARKDEADVVREIDPATFWGDLVAESLVPTLGPGVRDWLRAEAHQLMFAFGQAKSRPVMRSGVRSLLVEARRLGIPVGIVSNTVSGRSVRAELVEFGLDEFIAVHAYSDEVGWRKPDPRAAEQVLIALGADPAAAWFVGDKPNRDVLAARAAGIGTAVLVRGGKFVGDVPADAAPDLIVDELDELVPLLKTADPTRTDPSSPQEETE